MYDSPQVETEHLLRLHQREGVLSCSKARYYNPGIGRFASQDPFYSIRTSNGLNRYIYVANGPAAFVDPLGLYTVDGTCKVKGFEDLNIPAAVESLCKGPKKCKQHLEKIWIGGNKDSLWQCIEKYCKSKTNTIYCGCDPQYDDVACGQTVGASDFNPSSGLRICTANLPGNVTTCPCEIEPLTTEVTIFHETLHNCGLVSEPGSGTPYGNILKGLVKKCYGYTER